MHLQIAASDGRSRSVVRAVDAKPRRRHSDNRFRERWRGRFKRVVQYGTRDQGTGRSKNCAVRPRGLGKSDPNPRSYRIEDEATALRRALDGCDIHGSIILVAHSYGGFISEIVASVDKRVRGLVLIDANIPSFFDDREATIISARYTPLAENLIKEKPDLGRNLLRQDQAYPATARHMRNVHVPLNLPVIDITAQHTWVDAPDELAAMRRAHAAFVAVSHNRDGIFAKGSGHYVFKDQPDLVTEAMLRMISKIREQESTSKR